MKKTLVAALIGLAATASVMAQGRIVLFNYAAGDSSDGIILGADGVTPVSGGFTVGLYFSLTGGQVLPGGSDVPGVGWTYGGTSGNAVTATWIGPGYYQAAGDFSIPGYVDPSPNPATPVSLIVVAYNGADYASSTIRGHSAAFNITPAVGANGSPGTAIAPDFQVSNVSVVPEPSTFALAGFGLASLLIFRRRK